MFRETNFQENPVVVNVSNVGAKLFSLGGCEVLLLNYLNYFTSRENKVYMKVSYSAWVGWSCKLWRRKQELDNFTKE